MTQLLLLFSGLLVAGILLLWLARRVRLRTGLPAGKVVYSDTDSWQKVDKPLISRRYGLVGKPDYLVQASKVKSTQFVPVEVKSRKRPPEPYASHILQLATYCLLVEDIHKQRPSYGLLHYADATLQIPFTDALRQQVIETADAIRQARDETNVRRQHKEPGRCRNCGYRHDCGNDALG